MNNPNTTRTAVVLFNLGGPDKPESVRPFLYNLFNDPAIMRVPFFIRPLLANLIAFRRAPYSQKMYEKIGGKSPLLENTKAQADALERRLMQEGNVRVFTCMRYWHPMSKDVAQEVKLFEPDQIILLPLYPQFSTTTTASSIKDWEKSAKKIGLTAKTKTICCYPTNGHFIAAMVEKIKDAYWEASENGTPRVLFVAHGLPEKIVTGGDPYQWQVEQTVKQLKDILFVQDLDYQICYQSRVGPLKWIGPSAEEEIQRAGNDKTPIVMVPVSFVSEHSETLVELDMLYKEMALAAGAPSYVRVPTVSTHSDFIEGLAQQCMEFSGVSPCPANGKRLCPQEYSGCPCT